MISPQPIVYKHRARLLTRRRVHCGENAPTPAAIIIYSWGRIKIVKVTRQIQVFLPALLKIAAVIGASTARKVPYIRAEHVGRSSSAATPKAASSADTSIENTISIGHGYGAGCRAARGALLRMRDLSRAHYEIAGTTQRLFSQPDGVGWPPFAEAGKLLGIACASVGKRGGAEFLEGVACTS